jgi:hypothetical protein
MRALSRIAAAAGLGLFVLFGLLLAVLPGQGDPRSLSVFSAEADGWRAMYLTLEQLGFPVEAWSGAPGELPAPGTLLVLAEPPAPPPALPAALARAGEAPVAGPRRGRDLAHYRSFVQDGGTLLVLGVDEAVLATLRDELGLDVPDVDFEAEELDPTELVLSDERIPWSGTLPGALSLGAGQPLVSTDDGRVLAAAVPSGQGRVGLLVLESERLANRDLREDAEGLLLLVRLLEGLRPFERVLFDEYALGAWHPPAALGLAFTPRIYLLSAHLLLLLVLLSWRSAWSGPFARDPEPLRAVSPLARARGTGRLLARGGRFELLASYLRRGRLARWEARTGRTGAEADEPMRLRRLARGDERRLARLSELWARRPADEAELARLDAELGGFEPELVFVEKGSCPRKA